MAESAESRCPLCQPDLSRELDPYDPEAVFPLDPAFDLLAQRVMRERRGYPAGSLHLRYRRLAWEERVIRWEGEDRAARAALGDGPQLSPVGTRG